MASVLSIEDIRVLEKTQSVRERLLDILTAKETMSTSAKDVEALTGLVDSMDKSVFTKAKLTLDENANKINEESKEVLRNLIVSIHKGEVPQISSNATQRTEMPTFIPSDVGIIEGELIPKQDIVDADYIMSLGNA